MDASATDPILAAAASKCVSCGLCVPLCPTWQVSRNEADSPRGRIMLMRQLANGAAPADTGLYLDACLGCGRCEQACPSDVPFLDMLPRAKGKLRIRQRLSAALLRWLVRRQRRTLPWFTYLFATARLLRASGLAGLLPGKLQALALAAPRKPQALALPATPTGDQADQVELFIGCLGEALDNDSLQAAASLLTATGHTVSAPASQGCCGAIALHAGDTAQAQACASANLGAFGASGHIATTATGCAAQLRRGLSQRVVAAGELVARRARRLRLRAANDAVALVHVPCSQHRMGGDDAWVYELLAHIPGLQVKPAPGNDTCCGAGGLTSLNHPATSDELARRKVAGWQRQLVPGAIVVTTNYSCGWHLATAAQQAGLQIQLTDPLSLAQRHLQEGQATAGATSAGKARNGG